MNKIVIEKSLASGNFWLCIIGHLPNPKAYTYLANPFDDYAEAFRAAQVAKRTADAIAGIVGLRGINESGTPILVSKSAFEDMQAFHHHMAFEELGVFNE